MNKYERDSISDVVVGILRDHFQQVGTSIDSQQMCRVIEKGYAHQLHPFPARDPSRAGELAEEIDRLMRRIGRGDIGAPVGYQLSERADGKATLTYFRKSTSNL